ncbi:methyltransferase family protein [Thioalkalivibrio sp. HK1]|uniref:methyltransferase family protein n=1 Tax=Thioalkalivibrio sp. HK1 TaxID=1469245 RepID=UPI000571EF9D|nr:isoprenylcysteine carboxylmethyltransferase family protein [Thioalkalivibrio sp. HK1]
MESSGRFLFRWRSYFLLCFAPLIILSLREPEYLELYLGDTLEDLFEYFCVAIMLAGLALRVFTVAYVPKGTSGRTTKTQIADTLNTTGLYSVVRNPLYLGNCLIYLGILLFSQKFLITLCICFFLVIYYERIILAEEAFLTRQFKDSYLQWAKKTPAFIPNLTLWQPPRLPFSLKSVLRREYTTWLVAFFSLFCIEVGGDLLADANRIDTSWLIALIIACVLYLVLRQIKKQTNLLDVDGR